MFLKNSIYLLLVVAVTAAINVAAAQKENDCMETVDFVKSGLTEQIRANHDYLKADISILKEEVKKIQSENAIAIDKIMEELTKIKENQKPQQITNILTELEELKIKTAGQFDENCKCSKENKNSTTIPDTAAEPKGFQNHFSEFLKNAVRTVLQENQTNTTEPTTTVQTEIQKKTTEITNSLKCDPLTFHTFSAEDVRVLDDVRTVERANNKNEFGGSLGGALTRRQLRSNELFEVRVEQINDKFNQGIAIGVTVHSPEQFNFYYDMTSEKSGNWGMFEKHVSNNGVTIKELHDKNLWNLEVGDRVGVLRKDDGTLHFYLNGQDMGVAATAVPEHVYGFIDLWGMRVEQAKIVDLSECQSFA